MSIFPTTRLGRALVVAALVTGAAKIVPFLLQVFSLAGDELTELPPLTPAGTTRSFLLDNPVTWFLAATAVVWLALLLRDGVRRLTAPPPRRPGPRSRASTATRSSARPASRTTTSSRTRRTTPAATTKRATPAKSATRTTGRSASRNTAARPASRAGQASRSGTTTRRTSPRR